MLEHVPLDRVPQVQNLPAAEGADVMDPLQQDGVLQAFPDRPGVVFDADRQLVGGQVRSIFFHRYFPYSCHSEII